MLCRPILYTNESWLMWNKQNRLLALTIIYCAIFNGSFWCLATWSNGLVWKVERPKRYEEDAIRILSPRPPTGAKCTPKQHSGPEGEHSESSESVSHNLVLRCSGRSSARQNQALKSIRRCSDVLSFITTGWSLWGCDEWLIFHIKCISNSAFNCSITVCKEAF